MFGIRNGVVNHGGVAAELRPEGAGRHFIGTIASNSWASKFYHAGYHTASISSFPFRHSAGWLSYGFMEALNLMRGTGGERADEVLPGAHKWIAENGRKDDWFLHVHLWDPPWGPRSSSWRGYWHRFTGTHAASPANFEPEPIRGATISWSLRGLGLRSGGFASAITFICVPGTTDTTRIGTRRCCSTSPVILTKSTISVPMRYLWWHRVGSFLSLGLLSRWPVATAQSIRWKSSWRKATRITAAAI